MLQLSLPVTFEDHLPSRTRTTVAPIFFTFLIGSPRSTIVSRWKALISIHVLNHMIPRQNNNLHVTHFIDLLRFH